MSDEHMSGMDEPGMPDEVSRPMGEEAPASTKSQMGDLSSPEGMVALGGLVLIGTYVIFGLIATDYWVGWIAVLLSVSAVLLNRSAGFTKAIAPRSVLLKAIGYLLLIVGVLALVEDIRFPENTLDEMPDLLGALLSYAGYGIAFWGARSIET